MRPDIGVSDHAESWKLVIPKGRQYVCEVTVPHEVLEWFACLRDRLKNEIVWSDWMDYGGYDASPKAELESSMIEDIESFADRVSKDPLTLPLQIYKPKA